MRYAEYLNRTMDQLTLEAWEQSLLDSTSTWHTPTVVHSHCWHCGSPIGLELSVAIHSAASTIASHDPEDALLTPMSHSATDTIIELNAFTSADLVLA